MLAARRADRSGRSENERENLPAFRDVCFGPQATPTNTARNDALRGAPGRKQNELGFGRMCTARSCGVGTRGGDILQREIFGERRPCLSEILRPRFRASQKGAQLQQLQCIALAHELRLIAERRFESAHRVRPWYCSVCMRASVSRAILYSLARPSFVISCWNRGSLRQRSQRSSQ